jgi:hypothetical protein
LMMQWGDRVQVDVIRGLDPRIRPLLQKAFLV